MSSDLFFLGFEVYRYENCRLAKDAFLADMRARGAFACESRAAGSAGVGDVEHSMKEFGEKLAKCSHCLINSSNLRNDQLRREPALKIAHQRRR